MPTTPNLIPLRYYLQLEALAVFAIAVTTYASCQFNWWLFGGLFFTPDLFMLGYLFGKRAGALTYNLAHTYFIPLLFVGAGTWLRAHALFTIGLIWCAHIGFDRMLGFGLKNDAGFKDTHLNRLA